MAAVEAANTAFKLYIKFITEGNLAKLTEIERIKAAKVFPGFSQAQAQHAVC